MKLRNILYLCAALLTAGCTEDDGLSTTLSGEGKTPLLIEASLSTGNAATRAAGKDFASGDELIAYLRHTTGDKTGDPLAYPTTTADRAPLLVTFTKGTQAMAYGENIGTTGDLTPVLYWDDFSNSASESTDLRTSKHGLQSYYGYCYNGGTPSTALTQTTGALGWTVQTDQSTAESFQHSDLLWSAEQTTVAYQKTSTAFTAGFPMRIPYTHAMSEVTVVVNTDATFATEKPLNSTVLTLNAMNTVTSLTAPSGTYTSTTPASIKMFANAYSSGNTRTFTAIVAPGTKLKVDDKLLDIVNVEDNNYELKITSSMIPKDEDEDDSNNLAWSKDHKVSTETTKDYILTKPGYNYKLTIEVSKTPVVVEATLADWTDVNASGTGEIQYPNDVVTMNVTGDSYADESSFSLFWQVANGTSNDEVSERINNDTYTFATVSSYSASASAWSNTPTIYWPNQTDNYYFRALAKFNSTTSSVHDIESVGTISPLDKGTAVSQGTIAAGHDILWGTTPAHTGSPNDNSFTAGQAIAPRTGNVPIAFQHAMSKVTFQLETTDDADVTVNNAKVNLTGATIAISNLSTSGTINIEDGSITPAATTAAAITATAAPISDLIVIPQTIGNDAIVTITLTDGTTYRLQLNQCVVSGGSTPITAWERGKNYTYTIHLEKEQIIFRALIMDWDEKEGSGNANLEWD